MTNMFGFDLTDKEIATAETGGGDFKPLPAGWYDTKVDRAEVKDTRAGDKMLCITFIVQTGQFINRLIFANFVYGSTNDTARNIAKKHMARISQVAGINPQNAEGFLGAHVGVKVIEKPKKGDYPAGNDVRDIGPVPEAGATQAPASAAGGKGDIPDIPW